MPIYSLYPIITGNPLCICWLLPGTMTALHNEEISTLLTVSNCKTYFKDVAVVTPVRPTDRAPVNISAPDGS